MLADVSDPYCKGCGHTMITRAIAKAMTDSGTPRNKLCLTSDIGCVGLVDKLFPSIHTVHAIHGRSTVFAAGMSIADGVLGDGQQKTVVVIGDGGANIGLLHLANAAQMNVNMTVVLHNNHLFGMTGGQASGLSPEGWVSATTPKGNAVSPLDIVGILKASGATFLARELATNPRLSDRIAEGIAHPGFALIEVIEICVPYGIKSNKLTGPRLKAIAEATGAALGVVVHRTDRPAFREICPRPGPQTGQPLPVEPPLSVSHALHRPLRLIIAGTAGERVQSAARNVARCAVAAGLFATQKNDNLVTQGTGFSLSELVLSPSPIRYTGIDHPDYVVALSEDGLNKLQDEGVFHRLSEAGLAIVDDTLLNPPEGLGSRLLRLPLRKQVGSKNAANGALGMVMSHSGALPVLSLVQMAERTWGSRAKATLKALAWGEVRGRELRVNDSAL